MDEESECIQYKKLATTARNDHNFDSNADPNIGWLQFYAETASKFGDVSSSVVKNRSPVEP